jgi:kynureninase
LSLNVDKELKKRDSTVRQIKVDFSRWVTVNPPHAYEVSRELLARDIVIDYRPQAGIRVSPHFYNSDDEIRLVIETIHDILDSGAWQRHAGERAFVT